MRQHKKHDVADKVHGLAECLRTNHGNSHSYPQSLIEEAVMGLVKEAGLYDNAVAAHTGHAVS